MSEENQKACTTYANAVRALAAFVEAHPEVEPPSIPCPDVYRVNIAGFKLLALSHGVKKEKNYYEDRFYLRIYIPYFDADGEEHNLMIDYNGAREEVCKRVVTGIRRVEECYIPGRLEPAYNEDIVEWECAPILATLDEVPEA
jgi:hypothetical protein